VSRTMTILISIFGFAGRIAGDLLTSALGWASSLLFGRVPRSHQIFVVLMMAGSFTWLLFVLQHSGRCCARLCNGRGLASGSRSEPVRARAVTAQHESPRGSGTRPRETRVL
jgi:hypothetical protein